MLTQVLSGNGRDTLPLRTACSPCVRLSGRVRRAEIGGPAGRRPHRQNDIKMLFVESKNNLHPVDLVSGTEFDGLRGTQEIHCLCAVIGRNASLFQIKPRFFVLKQNFHRCSFIGLRRPARS